MNNIMEKFKRKDWVQSIMVEVIGNLIMLMIGLVVAYYVKIIFFS